MTADEDQIRDLIDRWAEAVHGGDLEGVLADHSEDIVMFDVPPPEEGVRVAAVLRMAAIRRVVRDRLARRRRRGRRRVRVGAAALRDPRGRWQWEDRTAAGTRDIDVWWRPNPPHIC
jgi:hypothetical protein